MRVDPQAGRPDMSVHESLSVQGLEPPRRIGEERGQARIVVRRRPATQEPVPDRAESLQRPVLRHPEDDVGLGSIADRLQDAGGEVELVEPGDHSGLSEELPAKRRIGAGFGVEDPQQDRTRQWRVLGRLDPAVAPGLHHRTLPESRTAGRREIGRGGLRRLTRVVERGGQTHERRGVGASRFQCRSRGQARGSGSAIRRCGPGGACWPRGSGPTAWGCCRRALTWLRDSREQGHPRRAFWNEPVARRPIGQITVRRWLHRLARRICRRTSFRRSSTIDTASSSAIGAQFRGLLNRPAENNRMPVMEGICKPRAGPARSSSGGGER